MDLRNLHANVERLFSAGGQAGMESAIALWYLKRASAATCQNTIDDAIYKACSLDPVNTPLWLAENCHCKNQFDKACQYYLKTFQADASNRSHWQHIGEYLLRYGTSDQVIDFYTQVVSADRDNNSARFILDCYAYFEELKQQIGARILCADHDGRGTDRFLMQVVFWGPRYTDIFLNYLLPALCAPGNLPSMGQDRRMHFIIGTDAQGARQLERHPWFAQIKKYVLPHVITFSRRLFKHAQHIASQNGGKWAIPSTMLTNAVHYAVLECGRRMDSDVLTFSPDHILSDRFMTEMRDAFAAQDHALAGPGFRLHYETPLLKEIESRYRKADGTLAIAPQEMVRLLIDHLPEPNFVHAEQFSNYPIYLCWRVDKAGIVAHVNHYHPWVVRGRGLRPNIQLSLDPIDGAFLYRSLADPDAIAYAPQAMMSFDLGNNPLCLPTDNNQFNPQKVAHWVRPYLSPVHEQYFRNSLVYAYNGQADSQRWEQMVSEAEQLVKEIIADAKPI